MPEVKKVIVVTYDGVPESVVAVPDGISGEDFLLVLAYDSDGAPLDPSIGKGRDYVGIGHMEYHLMPLAVR